MFITKSEKRIADEFAKQYGLVKRSKPKSEFCVCCGNQPLCKRDGKHCPQIVVTVKAGA